MTENNEREEERDEKATINIPLAALLQWIPIWLAIIGMFLSAANVYANVMTRLGTLETRLNLYSEILSDVKDDIGDKDRKSLRDRQEAQDKEEQLRNE